MPLNCLANSNVFKDVNRSNEIRGLSIDLTKHLEVMRECVLPAVSKVVQLPTIRQRKGKRNNQYHINHCLSTVDVTLK